MVLQLHVPELDSKLDFLPNLVFFAVITLLDGLLFSFKNPNSNIIARAFSGAIQCMVPIYMEIHMYMCACMPVS